MLKKLLVSILGFFCVTALVGGGVVYYYYKRITADLPNFKSVEEYRPPAVTQVFARDGTLIGEFFKERRYPVSLSEIPVHVRHAFLAAEDANFYSHPGIDLISIGRALFKNVQSRKVGQGASTITQQVIKNLLLTSERKLERKLKEAILAYRLEKRLSKDGILEIYLNQIFFGNTAYGISAAAKVYYHKEVGALSIAEAAMLAGLPKAPSSYSPVADFKKAKSRQGYVLEQMRKAGFISIAEKEQADKEEITVYPASQQNIFHSPYFVSELLKRFTSDQTKWPSVNIDADGLKIYTSLDLVADSMARKALRQGLAEVDKRRGWRGPLGRLTSGERSRFAEKYPPRAEAGDGPQPALVTEIRKAQGIAMVEVNTHLYPLSLPDTWNNKRIDDHDKVSYSRAIDTLKVGDVIEVSLIQNEDVGGKKSVTVKLDQTPLIEGGIVMLDPHSGRVVTMYGGYDYTRSSFNRVSEASRQPGSAFKPIVYLAAIDGFKYTPSTIVNDSPRTFRVGDQFWSPSNFDSKFLGPIILQTALERSRNLVSVEVVSRIGLKAVIEYARKLGITSALGRNLSLSLGSSEVRPLELTRAYGVLAAGGILYDTVMVDRIYDRKGAQIYDYESERMSVGKQVIDEKSSFLLSHMMKGVIERGTAMSLKALQRPVAGKTGTTNDQMDAWFIGFTPQFVTGVWVGFDQKKNIGDKETGGKVAAPIFLQFMKSYLDTVDASFYEKIIQEAKAESEKLDIEYVKPEKPLPLDFRVPEGVDPIWINRHSGYATSPEASGAILEYYKKGTEPKSIVEAEAPTSESYLESPDL
jgi:penicillin-binding protein 1A